MHRGGKKSIRYERLRSQLIEYLPRMRRFAHGLVRDPDQADDLVQEACERALERLHQFRAGSRLDSWLYRIIHTRWIDGLRKNKTRSAHLTLLKRSAGESSRTSHAQSSGIEAAMDAKSALAMLPEDQRAAILLVVIEGYSYAEAASVMNVPAGTVASRVARARAVMNHILKSGRRKALRPVASPKIGR